jgi:hypothetical protein
MLRIPHCLDNRRLRCQPYTPAALYSPQNYDSASGTHFYYRLSKPQGLVRLERLGVMERIIHFIGSRTRDLLACNVPHFISRVPPF